MTIEKLTNLWKEENFVMNSKAFGIPAGYQTLADLVDRDALTLRQAMVIVKELLTLICNLHSHELVQKDLVINDVFVKLPMSVSTNHTCTSNIFSKCKMAKWASMYIR